MKKSQNSHMLPKEPGLIVTSAASKIQTKQPHIISSTLLLDPLRCVFSSLWVDLNWVWIVIFAAWIKLWLIGQSSYAHSHSGMHSEAMRSSIFASIHLYLSFLAHWQLMIVAMMLPSVLPVIRAFRAVSRIEHQRSLMQIVFLLSYVVVWTLAAVGLCLIHISIPLASEIFLLKVMPSIKGLDDWIWVQGVVLMGAGLFQFTLLKQNCLKGCRSAAMVIAQFYQQGIFGAWRLG